MDEDQTRQVIQMRGLPDSKLIAFYSVAVIGSHEAKRTADFKRYDRDYPIVRYTEEEILRRMQERNHKQGFNPF